jgi:hypothetical protein
MIPDFLWMCIVSTKLHLYLPPEALTRRVPRLLEMDERFCSQSQDDVTYHVQTGACFAMPSIDDAAAAVSCIEITARMSSGEQIGHLEAFIFDVEKLADLGLMEAFTYSENTLAAFKAVYQGDCQDESADYVFQPEFTAALRAKLSAEVIQERELSFAIDEYCMGYHLANLESFELDNEWVVKGIDREMLEILFRFSDYFDFMLMNEKDIPYARFLAWQYPENAGVGLMDEVREALQEKWRGVREEGIDEYLKFIGIN